MTPCRQRIRLGRHLGERTVVLALGVLLFLALAGPAAAQGRRLALLVGIGAFASGALPDLEYAHRDVSLVRSWLLDPMGGGFAARDVTVLQDDQATKAGILAAAAAMARRAEPDDLVLLYFSSHGFYTQDQVVGIVCHDTRPTGQTGPQGGPIVERDSTLTRDDLYTFLDGLKARRRVVIVDACHSADLTEPERAPAREDAPHRDQRGATLVLASCLQAQRAWESNELGASIFTYFILEGLRANGGDLVRAFLHAQRETERQAQCEKGWCQTPYLIMLPSQGSLFLGADRES